MFRVTETVFTSSKYESELQQRDPIQFCKYRLTHARTCVDKDNLEQQQVYK